MLVGLWLGLVATGAVYKQNADQLDVGVMRVAAHTTTTTAISNSQTRRHGDRKRRWQ